MSKVFRSAYSGAVSSSIDFSKSPSRTKQSFRDAADINSIVAKARKTGILGDPTSIGSRKAVFGDFSSSGDFMAVQNRLVAVRNAFDELPSDVRLKFNNDPASLIDFMADSRNDAEAIKLGLKPKPAPAPDPAPVAPVVAPTNPAPVPAPVSIPEPKAKE